MTNRFEREYIFESFSGFTQNGNWRRRCGNLHYLCCFHNFFFFKTNLIIRVAHRVSVYAHQANEKQSIQKNEGHSKNKSICIGGCGRAATCTAGCCFRFPAHVLFDIKIYLKSLYLRMAQRLKEGIDLHLSLLEFANHKYSRWNGLLLLNGSWKRRDILDRRISKTAKQRDWLSCYVNSGESGLVLSFLLIFQEPNIKWILNDGEIN